MNWTWPELNAARAELGIADREAAAAALNLQTVAGPTEVPIVEVTRFLRNAVRPDGSTAWLAILGASGTVPAAKAAVDYNNDPRAVTLDLDTLVARGMLASLVANSVITQAEADGVRALGQRRVARWNPPIDAGTLQTAENEP